MDLNILARLGLARLRHPVPMAKLSTVHAAAALIRDSHERDVLWNALVQWVSEIELESEVVEALCIPILADNLMDGNVAALQRAIKCPSPLSHLYLGEISGHPLRFNSWAKSHSGEVPVFFPANEIEEELTAGHIVPHILATRIQSLEDDLGFPLLRQWSYEYQRLVDNYGEQSDGHWEHFVEGERGRDAGHFITRRGHLARSAFLRTLSAAYDLWDMPESMVYEEAMYATAADFTFLRTLPGKRPSFTDTLQEIRPVLHGEWQEAIEAMLQKKEENMGTPELLHCDLPITATPTYQANLKIVTCLYEGDMPQADEIFSVYNCLLGNIEFPRTARCDINILSTKHLSLTLHNGSRVLPVLMPAIGKYVGYFNSDLIRRTPYLPANLLGSSSFYARPRVGGMDILLDGQFVGEMCYWNHKWSPTYDKALGPNCGVSLSLCDGMRGCLFSIPQMKLSYHWRANVLTRDKEYGEWNEETLLGTY